MGMVDSLRGTERFIRCFGRGGECVSGSLNFPTTTDTKSDDIAHPCEGIRHAKGRRIEETRRLGASVFSPVASSLMRDD